LAVGTWSLLADADVPLLVYADLGFHELGHLIGYVVGPPEWVTAIAGTGLQVAVPLGAAVVLAVWRREPFGTTVCLAWAATSLRNGAVYVADAPYERLPLIGGEHDWAYLLGEHWNALDAADDIAAGMRFAGWALLFVGLAITVLAVEHHVGRRRRERAPIESTGVL
jgi:hypothetical protein